MTKGSDLLILDLLRGSPGRGRVRPKNGILEKPLFDAKLNFDFSAQHTQRADAQVEPSGLSYRYLATAIGKGKNGDFQFGRMLMLFSDDLFSAIGVKSFALNMLRDTYDCFEDMTALVHAVGSMDARKHISHDVKVAFLTKHIRYEDAWDESSILALDGKRPTPQGSLTPSQERSKEFFSGLF